MGRKGGIKTLEKAFPTDEYSQEDLKYIEKVSNLRSMYADYQEIGDRLWDRFNAVEETRAMAETLEDHWVASAKDN